MRLRPIAFLHQACPAEAGAGFAERVNLNSKSMNILFIGEIFGSPGRRIVADHLQDIVEANRIHHTIAKAEYAAGRFSVTPTIGEGLIGKGLGALTASNPRLYKAET